MIVDHGDTSRSPLRIVPPWNTLDHCLVRRTRFNDYVGTVAADDAEAVKGHPSLYELANIDRDLYTIVAVDLRIDGPVLRPFTRSIELLKGSDQMAMLRS
jgi:hypothetical protein